MNKRCARCEKTVYPIEELKCLDKIWHKGCFKCQECGMTLSMKTYKGFNKFPYCEAHIPKAKATTVAETPETKRLAENTKIQSNVQYHADFEKNKAKFTQVADDPETKRIKQNTKIISNVSYHGDLEKKAIMELKRSNPADEETSKLAVEASHGDYYKQTIPNPIPNPQSSPLHHQNQPAPHSQSQKAHHPEQQQPHMQPVQQSYRGGTPSVSHSYTPIPAPNHNPPSSQQPYYAAHPHHSPSANHSYEQPAPNIQPSPYYHKGSGGMNNVGSSANPPYHHHHHHHHPNMAQNLYQDANHNSPYSAARNSQTLIYSSQTGPVQQPSTTLVGSIADYDPVNEQYGSIAQKRAQPHRQDVAHQGQRSNLYPEGNKNYSQSVPGSQMRQPQTPSKVNAPPTHLGRCYRAIYDYEAADTDEVSFRDGDLLTNCTSIDEGWMMGTVQRTGRVGMLPANYVERAS